MSNGVHCALWGNRFRLVSAKATTEQLASKACTWNSHLPSKLSPFVLLAAIPLLLSLTVLPLSIILVPPACEKVAWDSSRPERRAHDYGQTRTPLARKPKSADGDPFFSNHTLTLSISLSSCHYYPITTIMSLLPYHYHHVTTVLSLPSCYYCLITTKMSLLPYHCNHVSNIALSLPSCDSCLCCFVTSTSLKLMRR